LNFSIWFLAESASEHRVEGCGRAGRSPGAFLRPQCAERDARGAESSLVCVEQIWLSDIAMGMFIPVCRNCDGCWQRVVPTIALSCIHALGSLTMWFLCWLLDGSPLQNLTCRYHHSRQARHNCWRTWPVGWSPRQFRSFSIAPMGHPLGHPMDHDWRMYSLRTVDHGTGLRQRLEPLVMPGQNSRL